MKTTDAVLMQYDEQKTAYKDVTVMMTTMVTVRHAILYTPIALTPIKLATPYKACISFVRLVDRVTLFRCSVIYTLTVVDGRCCINSL